MLQGLGNAAVAVVAMAIVRDLFAGSAAATLLSRLMLVMGIAPILAPDHRRPRARPHPLAWRVRLARGRRLRADRGAACWACARRCPASAAGGAPCAVLAHLRRLLRDRTFVGLVLISGLMFATLFSYIAGSSFVLQDIYGLERGPVRPGLRAELPRLS